MIQHAFLYAFLVCVRFLGWLNIVSHHMAIRQLIAQGDNTANGYCFFLLYFI